MRSLEAVAEPSAALSEGNGVVVHIWDEGQYSFWQVSFDIRRSHALIDKLAKKVFGVIEGNVILFVMGVWEWLCLSFEGREGAHDWNESFTFKCFFKAIEISLT